MRKLLQFLFLLGAIIFLGDLAQAQGKSSFKKHKYSSIGVSINAMNYVGEVDPGPSFLSPGIKFTRPDFSVCYIKRLKPRVSARGTVSWGRIKGSDAQNASFNDKDIYRKFRNLNFRNDIFEIKADVIIDLFENRGRYTKRADYTPYIFAGIAYFHHNPKTLDNNGNWVALDPLKLEGKSFSLNQIALPVGLGFRYKLNKQWDLAFEMGWRFTLTDNLDGIGKTYVDKSTLGSQEAKDLSDRSGELFGNQQIASYVASKEGSPGDPSGFVKDPNSTSGYRINGFGTQGDKRGTSNRDWYIVTGFHLTYIIPGRVICPKFRTQYNDVQRRMMASID